ncbi:aKG-HExxH-type peptide beta-hydroxylase [Tateyamaria sp.]|uniref:aKG-HExxH-type peptide beta-hydroxylase n=1 Tax=Tateyamaria sp. TaxID=1929288 RepID=UPI00329FF48C
MDSFVQSMVGFFDSTQSDYGVDRFGQRIFADEESVLSCQRVFGASSLNDLQQDTIVGAALPARIANPFRESVLEALTFIKTFDPMLSSIVDLSINKIVVSGGNNTVLGNGANAASASDAIGLMWMCGDKAHSRAATVELIIHELSHNLMFVDELVWQHYDYDRIADKQAFCQSAILNKLRPIDKVVHSIVVALEVVQVRTAMRFGHRASEVHPSSEDIIQSTLDAIRSFEQNRYLDLVVTIRVREIIAKCKQVAFVLAKELTSERTLH